MSPANLVRPNAPAEVSAALAAAEEALGHAQHQAWLALRAADPELIEPLLAAATSEDALAGWFMTPHRLLGDSPFNLIVRGDRQQVVDLIARAATGSA